MLQKDSSSQQHHHDQNADENLQPGKARYLFASVHAQEMSIPTARRPDFKESLISAPPGIWAIRAIEPHWRIPSSDHDQIGISARHYPIAITFATVPRG